MAAVLKQFTLDPRNIWQNTLPWGNGHTRETDPFLQGWRLKARSAELCIIGRKADGGGVRGCASVLPYGDGRYDVAIYDELTPAELQAKFDAGENVPGDEYFQVDACGGWALRVLDKLHELHQSQ